MPDNYGKFEERINAIAMGIPLLEKSDFSPFAEIINTLGTLSQELNLPPAFETLIQRVVSKIEMIIMGGIDFEAGLTEVARGIEKIQRELAAFKRKTGSDSPGPADDSKPGPSIVPSAEGAVPSAPIPFEGDPSLLADFINEARDHIHSAETLLLELEMDQSNREKIDGVFRAWHTIKGVAGFLNLKEIQSLAHCMESLMDRARREELQLHSSCIDLFLESNDCLKSFIGKVEGALSGAAFERPENFAAIMERLTSYAMALKTVTPAVLEETGKKIGEILVDRGEVPAKEIESALALQASGDDRSLGTILIEENHIPARAIGSALAAQAASRTSAVEETIRVPVNRIDLLVDAIGEAVIAQSMIYASRAVKAIDDQSLHTKIGHAAGIMRQIQEMAMSLRMVSVKATFQKMARLARDLAKQCGRDIEFITEGEETELDKSVVEKIGDPLIHMVRNSVDHGIEPAEERAAAGKPPKATVKLKAYHRSGNIFIEISDDGKGLDRRAIIKKAVENGLCKAEDRLTDEEVFRFIFLPGFSTAKQVTDVSGRGVGMDVVRRNIEALRGSVEITSSAGKGTTFTIRLPLTLAIVDGMIVRTGSENYIIPTLAIVESLRPQQGQIDSILGKGKVIKVRSDLIPLIFLQSVFDGKNSCSKNSQTDGVVMIVEDMLGKKTGLFLDEIVGQQQVVIKSLGEEMGEIPGVTGGAIMNDGAISLILDVGGLVKMTQER